MTHGRAATPARTWWRWAAAARSSELVTAAGGLHVPCPEGYMPRAALGALVAPLFVTLFRVGLLPEAHALLVGAQEQLGRRRDGCRPAVEGARNPARELARRIDRTIPLVYGGGALGAVAAMRWKADVNENAKAPAFWNTHPELDHNEICGWGQHGDVTRQVFTLVELRHGFEHERLAPRFDGDAGPGRGVRGPGARGPGRGGEPPRPAARPHVPRRLGELLPGARERRGSGPDPRHHRAQGPPGAKLTPWSRRSHRPGTFDVTGAARRVDKPWGWEIHWTPDRPPVRRQGAPHRRRQAALAPGARREARVVVPDVGSGQGRLGRRLGRAGRDRAASRGSATRARSDSGTGSSASPTATCSRSRRPRSAPPSGSRTTTPARTRPRPCASAGPWVGHAADGALSPAASGAPSASGNGRDPGSSPTRNIRSVRSPAWVTSWRATRRSRRSTSRCPTSGRSSSAASGSACRARGLDGRVVRGRPDQRSAGRSRARARRARSRLRRRPPLRGVYHGGRAEALDVQVEVTRRRVSAPGIRVRGRRRAVARSRPHRWPRGCGPDRVVRTPGGRRLRPGARGPVRSRPPTR